MASAAAAAAAKQQQQQHQTFIRVRAREIGVAGVAARHVLGAVVGWGQAALAAGSADGPPRDVCQLPIPPQVPPPA